MLLAVQLAEYSHFEWLPKRNPGFTHFAHTAVDRRARYFYRQTEYLSHAADMSDVTVSTPLFVSESSPRCICQRHTPLQEYRLSRVHHQELTEETKSRKIHTHKYFL